MNSFKISVITVSYNSSKYISSTIRSVLCQTSDQFEYIILDDNSSDTSWEQIQSFKDERIKAYRNQTNLGEYGNRSKAIDLATGEYVIFIDGDDLMYPNAIETFEFYIKRFPHASMFFTREWDYRMVYPFEADPQTIYRFEFLDLSIRGGNFTKVLFRREDIIAAGYFPTNISTGDAYIQLKLALKHSAVVINDGLTWWRRRKGNATERVFATNRHLAESLNYKVRLLNDPDCPLTPEEMHQAKVNLYGLYLRSLVRMVFSFQLSDVVYLCKNIHIPSKYYSALFKPSKVNYYHTYNGDNPLHTPYN